MQKPCEIDLMDCVIDGVHISGKLTQNSPGPVTVGSFCGYPAGEVAKPVSAVENYRGVGCIASYYSLPNVFKLLEDYAATTAWECEQKDDEIAAKCEVIEQYRKQNERLIARIQKVSEAIDPGTEVTL